MQVSRDTTKKYKNLRWWLEPVFMEAFNRFSYVFQSDNVYSTFPLNIAIIKKKSFHSKAYKNQCKKNMSYTPYKWDARFSFSFSRKSRTKE